MAKGGVRGHARRLLALWTLLCLGAVSSAFAEDDGDFEYWAKASFRIPINERWQFKLDERLTFGDEARRLDDHQTDYAFQYSGLPDWLGVGFGFKQQFEKEGDGWLVENRPLVNILLRTAIPGLLVVDRSRFEYRILEDEENVWRYRNKISVTPPVAFTPWKLAPYMSQEIFVAFNEEDFNQHRVSGGFFVPLQEHVRFELFYVWKLNEEGDDWHDTNIVGSYVHFQF